MPPPSKRRATFDGTAIVTQVLRDCGEVLVHVRVPWRVVDDEEERVERDVGTKKNRNRSRVGPVAEIECDVRTRRGRYLRTIVFAGVPFP